MAGGDLLSALLVRLSPHVSEGAESSSEVASALHACAAEVRRFAEQAQEEDAREGLDLVSELLLEVALLAEKSERRWSRLAFDLHDGALQEVSTLRLNLHALRLRLADSRLKEASRLDRAVAFVDELDAGLESLDSSLRELVESFESPAFADQLFEESARRFVREFASDAGISVAVDLRGDFDSLTRSQRIALFRMLVGAMTNVRQHSGADRAWVSARVLDDRARLRVRDNGRGFDVRRTPPRAAKRGRRGLVGMAERVRLLGGQFDIDSKPGGPTTITATIPAGRVDEQRPALKRRTPKSTSGRSG